METRPTRRMGAGSCLCATTSDAAGTTSGRRFGAFVPTADNHTWCAIGLVAGSAAMNRIGSRLRQEASSHVRRVARVEAVEVTPRPTSWSLGPAGSAVDQD